MINVIWQTLLQSITVAQDVHLQRLHTMLLDDYLPEVRPTTIDKRPLNITFGFVLTQIIDVTWNDPQLVWNPYEYGNLTHMHLPYDRIWRPDVVLYNNGDVHYPKGVFSTNAVVRSDGHVTWAAAGILQSSCVMNVRYYPFDEQKCQLKFASWAYDGTKIDVLLDKAKGARTSTYLPSAEWVLLAINSVKEELFFSCCPNAPFPYIEFELHLRRRPMFYIFNLILPCIMISMVALIGFFMPCDSGEKVTLGITTLLSMTVFLMLVAENMPPTSDTLPLIGRLGCGVQCQRMFYGVTTFIVSFATAMTVVTLNVHHKGKGGRPVPIHIQKLAFNYVAVIFRVQVDSDIFKNDLLLTPPPMTADAQNTTYSNAKRASTSFTPNAAPNGSELPLLLDRRGVTRKCSETYEQMAYAQSRRARQRRRTNERVKNQFASQDEVHLNATALLERQFACTLKRMNSVMGESERRVCKAERREAIIHEWRLVAIVMDRLLLTIFVIGTVVTSFAILYQHGEIPTREQQYLLDVMMNQSLLN